MSLLSTQHLLSKESLLFYGMCTLPAGTSVHHTHTYVHGDQKVLDPLKLEFQMVLRCHVCAGNRI